MLTVALSLSVIVTVAVSAAPLSVICGSPLVTLFNLTITVSLASTIVSSTMPMTSITAEVWPARIVTVPLSVV